MKHYLLSATPDDICDVSWGSKRAFLFKKIPKDLKAGDFISFYCKKSKNKVHLYSACNHLLVVKSDNGEQRPSGFVDKTFQLADGTVVFTVPVKSVEKWTLLSDNGDTRTITDEELNLIRTMTEEQIFERFKDTKVVYFVEIEIAQIFYETEEKGTNSTPLPFRELKTFKKWSKKEQKFIEVTSVPSPWLEIELLDYMKNPESIKYNDKPLLNDSEDEVNDDSSIGQIPAKDIKLPLGFRIKMWFASLRDKFRR